jgi:Polysaccharide deacetylase
LCVTIIKSVCHKINRAIPSNLKKSTNFQTFCSISVVIAIVMMLIIGSSFPNMVLSKPSLQTPSSSGGIPGSISRGSAPNLYGIHNQSSSATPAFSSQAASSILGGNISGGFGSSNKIVMINFDDGYKSQLIYAKPILDKYGFKASFFIVCGKVATQPYWMNWRDIAQLNKDGMDIESHTMTHAHLNKLSTNALTYEIGGSKQCFASHGFNATILGYPLNLGSDKPSVVNLVAKYYDLGRSGTDPLMFLNCNGYAKDSQTDCRSYLTNGKLTHANRYDIRSASFYHISNKHNFSPPEMFQVFLQIINSQIPSNSNGKINAIPIIVYHNLTTSIKDYSPVSHASSTTVDLFAQEMKYLHDNGFKVLLLNQFGFDPANNVFYIKNVPSSGNGNTTSSGNGNTTNAATLIRGPSP